MNIIRTQILICLFCLVVASPARANRASRLIIAASRGQTTTIGILLSRGADVNEQDIYGNTALAFAAGNGHTATVMLLLDNGADANIKNKYGETALMVAARNAHIEIVRALLDKGARVNASSDNGNTVLSWARLGGHTGTVRVLQNKIAEEKPISGNDKRLAELPNQAEEKPVRPLMLKKVIDYLLFYQKQNLLVAAVVAILFIGIGQLIVTRYRIIYKRKPGVNIKTKDKDGRTALMGAAMNGHAEIVRILLDTGAEVNIKDKYGSTALMAAARYGHNEVVNLLKQAGAKE